MSILRALRKKGSSKQAAKRRLQKGRSSLLIRSSAKTPNASSPEMFVERNFKIGTPGLAFIGQSDSLVGTALPDSLSEITAGATLNAIGAPRAAEKCPPEFSVRTIKAGRAASYRRTSARYKAGRKILGSRNTNPARKLRLRF